MLLCAITLLSLLQLDEKPHFSLELTVVTSVAMSRIARLDSSTSSVDKALSSSVSSEMSPSSTSASRYQRPGFSFETGDRVEAKDYTNTWYRAKIVEVDWDTQQILIHFENWAARYDEWIAMDSSRLQPLPKVPASERGFPKKKYQVGEKVLAVWRDNKRYPATVQAVLEDDAYSVTFTDGYIRRVKSTQMSKMEQNCDGEEYYPLPKPTKFSVFDPVDIGTKEERRQRKRKFGNVADLFKSKRPRRSDVVSDTSSVSSDVLNSSVDSPSSLHHKSNNQLGNGDFKKDRVRVRVGSEGGVGFVSRRKRYEQMRLARHSLSSTDAVLEKAVVNDNNKVQRTKNGVSVKTNHDRLPNKRTLVESRKLVSRSKQLPADPGGNGLNFTKNGTKSNNKVILNGDGEYLDLGLENEKIIVPKGGNSRSILIIDKLLPKKWTKKAVQRQYGVSAGKWDIYLVSPEGRKFRSRNELHAYFVEKKIQLDAYKFDFTLGKKLTELLKDKLTNNKLLKEKAVPTVKENSEPDVKTVEKSKPKQKAEKPESKENDLPSKPDTAVDSQVLPVPSASVPPPPTPPATNQIEDSNRFVCPNEKCLKSFRKENLLQMHIKHYHPEYLDVVGIAPNVADLAYARTVGETVETQWVRKRASLPEKPSSSENRRTSTCAVSKSKSSKAVAENSKCDSAVKQESPKSPSKAVPKEETSIKSENISPTERTATSPTMSNAGSGAPKGALKGKLDWENMIMQDDQKTSTHERRKRTKSVAFSQDVIKHENEKKLRHTKDVSVEDKKDKSVSASESTSVTSEDPVKESLPGSTETVTAETLSPSKSGRRNRHKPPFLHLQKLNVYTDSNGIYSRPSSSRSRPKGRRVSRRSPHHRHISSFNFNQNEVVNCICGVSEEDGLMIQCDLCLCWQHGFCYSIEREDQVPEKYICFPCRYPVGGRESKRYIHDQDWIKEGKMARLEINENLTDFYPGILPETSTEADISTNSITSEKETELPKLTKELPADEIKHEQELKDTFRLSSHLIHVKNDLHSLQVKLNIARTQKHQKLYLWEKSWVSSAPATTSQTELPVPNDATTPLSDANISKIAASLSTADVEQLLSSAMPSDVNSGGEKAGDSAVRDHSYATTPASTTTKIAEENKESSVPNLDTVVEQLPTKDQWPHQIESNDDKKSTIVKGNTRKCDNSGAASDSANLAVGNLNSSTELNQEVLDPNESLDTSGLDLQLSQSDIEQLAISMEQNLMQQPASGAPNIPVPEAPIDLNDCRFNLLDHIEDMHSNLDAQLDAIESQVAEMEAAESLTEEDMGQLRPAMKQTFLMLLQDLQTVKDISEFQ